MQAGFRVDPSAPGRRIWRCSKGPAFLSGIAVLVLGLGACGMLLFAIVIARLSGMLALGLFIAVVSAVMIALTTYAARDFRGKIGGAVEIDAAFLTLDLPGGRSLIEPSPPVKTTLPLGDIAAVETRLEAFRSQGMALMQRAYRLTPKSGPPIFLFEERALGSILQEGSMSAVAAEIADRAGLPLTDLGMAEGKGGILGAWFTEAPSWSAAPLPVERQRALWRKVHWTGSFSGMVFMLIWCLGLVL